MRKPGQDRPPCMARYRQTPRQVAPFWCGTTPFSVGDSPGMFVSPLVLGLRRETIGLPVPLGWNPSKPGSRRPGSFKERGGMGG